MQPAVRSRAAVRVLRGIASSVAARIAATSGATAPGAVAGTLVAGALVTGALVVATVAVAAWAADVTHTAAPSAAANFASARLHEPLRGALLPITLNASGPPWADTSGTDVLDGFFSLDRIHAVHLEIDEFGVASLLERPRTYVHAAVTIDGARYDDVGVRLKGGAGSFVPLDGDYPPISGDGNGRPGKSAFIIDFNRYVRGTKHLGLRKLTLNNLVQDPSGIHEYLGYALFREAGVPASRAGFATVYLNDEEKGLYAALETPDNSSFLRHWFGTDEGNLYEGEYGTDLRADGVAGFDQDNGSDESRRDLRELVAVLDAVESGGAPFAALEAVIDVDRYLDYAVTELFLGHWDGYAWSTNNYMIHHDPVGGRWLFLPWGIDQLFEDPLGEFGGVMRRAGPAWTPGPGGRVHELCFDAPACRQRLHDAHARLLARVSDMDLVRLAGDARQLVQSSLLEEAAEFGDPDRTVHALEQVPRYIEEHSRTIEHWLPCLAGTVVDGDRDGFDGCSADCNDRDPRTHPGAPETCNFRDDDCNGRIDDPEECPKCLEWAATDGHAYALCFDPASWADAREACVLRGGELASFHDEPTFEHVTITFAERVGVNAAWIGLNDVEHEGRFVWSDDTPVDFGRWSPYAPRPDGNDLDCVLSREHGWIDVQCVEPHAYVCKSP